MKRTGFLGWLLWVGSGAVAVGSAVECPDSAVSVPQEPRPNVILVFVDDLGWPDLPAFGEDRVRTPAIDRLASEGIVFEQFYVNSPICSPSRVAISTGQYPQRWSITSFLDSAANNRRRGMADWLDPRAPMLPRILQAAGYATGHFGKWHMGGQRDVDAAPPITDYGFDESLTNFEGMGPKLLPLTMRPGWDEPRRIWEDAERLGGPVQWRMRSTITGGFVDAAMDFIARAEASGKPFYVNLWPDDVHGPWFPSVANWRGKTPDNYRAVLEEMDAQFAPLFDYIRSRPHLRDNTLILLCSDNGADPKTIDRRPWPLRGCKGTLYEGGIRSPLIVWGPGRIANGRAGSRNATSLLTAMDLVPSLLRLAGVDAPEDVAFDGQDLLDTLLGRTADSRLAPVFFGRPPDFKEFAGMADLPDLAMREDRWKLLCNADGRQIELFDVETDPTESRNLADSMPLRARAMAKRVVEWNQAIAP
ncbi:MAG: N-acetylgalactosamine-6-sulfatase [Planctomycetaceae bacterium]|nr:MAG: N-acetylgalactosamine-6-sulfatase [Planctomycetaceae bacterium]